MATNVLPFPVLPSNDNHDDPPRPPLALRLSLRGRIEATIEYLVGILDAADGDCDMEEDDPSGEHREGDGGPLLMPLYGIDQSLGPINEVAAIREYLEAQRLADEAARLSRRAA